MTPLYNGQENHYKKMLDLQEKLRKSEEERIRLEERFNILVQESRNRHQACINRLRIRYVEFLEEQRARDERNNRLLGTLDRVDNSLIMMSAKTERLNILRKQYEAYLLQTYGNQRASGSVTADSGLESQHEQEIPPSPIFSKSAQPVPRSTSTPYLNQDYVLPNLKTFGLDTQPTRRFSSLQNPPDSRRDLTLKFSQAAAASPTPYNDTDNLFKSRPLLPNYLDSSWKYTSPAKPEPSVIDSIPVKSPAFSPPAENDLDRYLGKIKQLHADLARSSEKSLEEADHEQNTSGDLLNMSLTEAGLEAEEEAKQERTRLAEARLAFAARNLGRTTRDGNELAIDKFSRPEIATLRDIRPLAQQQAVEASLDASRRLIQQNRVMLEEEEQPLQADGQESSDQESKEEGDGIEDDYDDTVDIDSWMPDDIDQRVEEVQDEIRDMPRRKLESIEEVEQTEDEDAAEEVKSEERAEEKSESQSPVAVEPAKEEKAGEAEDAQKPEETLPETEKVKDANDGFNSNAEYYQEDKNNQQQYSQNAEYGQGYDQQQAGDQQQYPQNAEYAQGYDQQQGEDQQQYPANAEYAQGYEQQQGESQQQYQYPDDYSQQYGYDANGQYTGYDNQQYAEGQYGDYMQEGYQYDPNQQYEQDPNQQYQQYEQYEGYQNSNAEALGTEGTDQTQYDANQAYDYSQQMQAYPEENAAKTGEAYRSDADQNPEHSSEQRPNESSEEQAYQAESASGQEFADEPSEAAAPDSKDSAKDGKRKKDKIKSILDSDTESYIEKNPSNTESDFDFN